jgi:hypothetical protein
MMPAVIELENISFIRQGRAILSGVNWRKKSVFASGCGKKKSGQKFQ